MELWIRSQNKQKLTKVNELNVFDFADFVVIRGCNNQETSFWLGNYKTRERALEVLDEIQKYILLPNTDNSAYVYEMPEE